MIPDREPKGTVPVQVLERDEVEVHGSTIKRTRVIIGDGVPRVLYHAPSTPDQQLAEVAHRIDDAKVWLNHPVAVSFARNHGTTPSKEVKLGVTKYVADLRRGDLASTNSVFGPLIQQRGLERLWRDGRNQEKAAERREMRRQTAMAAKR